MIQIIITVLTLATITLSIYVDAKVDANKFKRGQTIIHWLDVLIAGSVTMFMVVSLNYFMCKKYGYAIDDRFWELMAWYGFYYVAWRIYRFDVTLNKLRELPPNYYPVEIREYNSAWDKYIVPHLPPRSFYRLVIWAFVSVFWLDSMLHFFEPHFPRLDHYFGWAWLIGLSVAWLFLAVSWVRRNYFDNE